MTLRNPTVCYCMLYTVCGFSNWREKFQLRSKMHTTGNLINLNSMCNLGDLNSTCTVNIPFD